MIEEFERDAGEIRRSRAGTSAVWLWALLVGAGLAQRLLSLPAHLGPGRWVLAGAAMGLALGTAATVSARTGRARLTAAALCFGLALLGVGAGLSLGAAPGMMPMLVSGGVVALLCLGGAAVASRGRAHDFRPMGMVPALVGLLFLLLSLTR